MRNIWFAIGFLGSIATQSVAGQMCYTSTPQEDAQVADIAARQGVSTQAVIDKNMSQNIFNASNSVVSQNVGAALENQWPSMTNAKKTNICTQLGVSPCPP